MSRKVNWEVRVYLASPGSQKESELSVGEDGFLTEATQGTLILELRVINEDRRISVKFITASVLPHDLPWGPWGVNEENIKFRAFGTEIRQDLEVDSDGIESGSLSLWVSELILIEGDQYNGKALSRITQVSVQPEPLVGLPRRWFLRMRELSKKEVKIVDGKVYFPEDDE